MSTLTKPYAFTAGTNAVSSQVNADFDALFNWVNGGGAMWADGSVAFTGIPLLPGSDPTLANQAVRKQYVDATWQGNNAGQPCLVPNLFVYGANKPTRWVGGGVNVATDGAGNVTVTFPTAFTTCLISVSVEVDTGTGRTPNDTIVSYFNPTLSTVGFHFQRVGGPFASGFVWFTYKAYGF